MRFDPAWLLEGLTAEQIKGVIKVGWRIAIVGHIAWVCGWLAFMGIPAPFARAEELVGLERKTDVLLRAAIDTSLRGLLEARCQISGPIERETLNREINIQKTEWHALTKREWIEPAEQCKTITLK